MNAAVASTANLVGITGIARRLVQDGAMDESTARSAMTDASNAKVPLAHWIGEKKLVLPGQLAAANAIEFGIPLLDVSAFDPAHNALKLVSDELLQKHQVLPLFKRGNRLYVGITDPTQTRALDDIKFHTNLVVEPILVAEDQLKRTLDLWSSANDTMSGNYGDDDEGLENLETSGGDDDLASSDSGIDSKGDDTPVVKFVNKVLIDAIKRGASDIHFEPYETD